MTQPTAESAINHQQSIINNLIMTAILFILYLSSNTHSAFLFSKSCNNRYLNINLKIITFVICQLDSNSTIRDNQN